jgi:hypothetical protein
LNAKEQAVLDDINTAIGRALAAIPAETVLSFMTGAFVGLTVEFVRRRGHDVSKEIKIDGGRSRAITIHAPKENP